MSDSTTPSQKGSLWDSSPKVTFVLGLVAGLAIVSTIALVLVVNVLLSGKGLNTLANNQPSVPSAPSAPNELPSEPEAPPAQPPRAVEDGYDHIWGDANAPLTLIEYTDFECPFCLRHLATMNQIKQDYAGKVRIILRHFPLSFHANAQKAHEASECAADQGKFWEMYNKIFEANEKGMMGVQRWKDSAKELGLNTATFDNCLDSGEKAGRVQDDLMEGQRAGVQGTPTTFIDGQPISGAVPYETFKQIVDQMLAS